MKQKHNIKAGRSLLFSEARGSEMIMDLRACLLVSVLVLTGCGSKLEVSSTKPIGKVISAECINGGWGSVDKTVIKTDRASVPVRWCHPIALGEEAWLTFYQEKTWGMADQCWLYVSGQSYNCG